MKQLMIIICLVLSAFYCTKVKGSSTPFSQTTFKHIKQQYQGQKWLLILWSVECPPCFKELELIKKLHKKNSDLAVVLINTDDNQEFSSARVEIISHYQLNQLSNYYFVEGQASQNRYMIDPTWYGELPRSYFIDAQGIFHGKSGLVEVQLIEKWLVNNSS